MSLAKFIVDYISECSKQGKNAAEVAKLEVEEINRKLKEADDLRVRKSNILNFLNQIGDSTYKSKNTNQVDFEDDSEESLELQNKVSSFLKESDKPLTVREIINGIGSYDEDYKIIRTIKHLGMKGVIERDDSPEKKIKYVGLN